MKEGKKCVCVFCVSLSSRLVLHLKVRSNEIIIHFFFYSNKRIKAMETLLPSCQMVPLMSIGIERVPPDENDWKKP